MAMTFTYDEDMMADCLRANGWSERWAEGNWAPDNIQSDYCGFDLKEAFSMLLTSKNLYGEQWEKMWK